MTAWNHTIQYHHVLLDAVPARCDRALEIGCGEGDFARELATKAARVDAIDRDGEVLRRANQRTPSNVRFIEGDFMTHHLETESYDYVAALAVLHHLPLGPALERMRALVAPGGVVAVLGLFRERSVLDWLLSGLAVPVSRYHRLTRDVAPVNAPQRAPSTTLAELRAGAMDVLPGARLRRHLLFRFSLLWTKPPRWSNMKGASEPPSRWSASSSSRVTRSAS